jgi:shikimate kinase
LKLKLLDADALIEKEADASIKEIFETSGEAHFRGLEKRMILRITRGEFGSGVILSTGGGAVCDPESRAALRSWAVVISLSASVEDIVRRVGSSQKRPLLEAENKVAEVKRLLEERVEAYKDCDLMIDTTGVNVKWVVERIKAFLKERAARPGGSFESDNG